MRSERGKNESRNVNHRAEVVKKEERTGVGEKMGAVEAFLRKKGRKIEEPIIKKEVTIKSERSTEERWRVEKDIERGREERLRAIQEEPGEEKKSWLTKEMEKIGGEKMKREPTEEDIKLQLRFIIVMHLNGFNGICSFSFFKVARSGEDKRV